MRTLSRSWDSHFPSLHGPIMLADHSRLPADGALLSQPPKTGFSCKVVLQAVGRVPR